MNCQCNARWHGCWVKDPTGKNRPAWRCTSCDAFQEFMKTKPASLFRRQYFEKPKKERHTWMKGYTTPNPHKPAPTKPTTGTQLSLFMEKE